MHSSCYVYCDGLCQPMNPAGVATYGFVVYFGGELIYQESGIVGEGKGMSNNVAEYSALCAALRWLRGRQLHQHEIVVFSDSRLMVNQMSGLWRSNGGLYLRWQQEAKRFAQEFPRLRFEWIPRERNEQADRLSKEAYERYKTSKIV
ncbi:MAG: ribonuclease HI family protein [Nitrososphaerota archaeon]